MGPRRYAALIKLQQWDYKLHVRIFPREKRKLERGKSSDTMRQFFLLNERQRKRRRRRRREDEDEIFTLFLSS